MTVTQDNLIYSCKFGSHLYGTETENSDLDIKQVYIPSIEDCILGKVKHNITTSTGRQNSKNAKEDIDKEIMSIQSYMKSLCSGQLVALDMLFAPENMILERKSFIWSEITENKNYFITKDVYPIIGYCRRQANKYGIKGSRVASTRKVLELFKTLDPKLRLKDCISLLEDLSNEDENCFLEFVPTRDNKDGEVLFEVCDKKYQLNLRVKTALEYTEKLFEQFGGRALEAEKNKNVDWKSLHHALRVCHQGIELLETGNITFPLKDKGYLMDIKLGLIPFEKVSDSITDMFSKLEETMKTSKLREKPDLEKANEVILEAYRILKEAY